MAEKTFKTKIKQRYDLEANWSAKDPVLLAGEMAFSSDKKGMFKVGDGTSKWSELPYAKSNLEKDDITGALGYVPPKQDTWKEMTGATADAAGETGTVPAPKAGENGKFLRGDGTWADVEKATLGGLGITVTADEINKLDGVTNNVQNQLDGKANAKHTHDDEDITSVSASKITGTIDIKNLPQGALDRLVRVTDDDARFALTTDDIQLGDTVKVQSTGKMYYVVDESKLNEEAGYEPYTADTAASVPWSGVTGKPDIGSGTVNIKQNGEVKGTVDLSKANGTVNIELTDSEYTLPVAGEELGGVKSSEGANKVTVSEDGEMSVPTVSLASVNQTAEDVLILDCGEA